MCALTAHEHSLPADHHQVSPVGTSYINIYHRTACSTFVYEGTGDCSLLGTWISCFIWFCLPALFKLAGSDTFKCFTLERHVHVLFKDFLVSWSPCWWPGFPSTKWKYWLQLFFSWYCRSYVGSKCFNTKVRQRHLYAWWEQFRTEPLMSIGASCNLLRHKLVPFCSPRLGWLGSPPAQLRKRTTADCRTEHLAGEGQAWELVNSPISYVAEGRKATGAWLKRFTHYQRFIVTAQGSTLATYKYKHISNHLFQKVDRLGVNDIRSVLKRSVSATCSRKIAQK